MATFSELARWREIRLELEDVLEVTADHPRGFAATFEGSLVVVEHLEGVVGAWLIISTPICAQHELDLESALARSSLAFATIVLSDGRCWLRVAVPFDSDEMCDPRLLAVTCIREARAMVPVCRMPVATRSEIFTYYAD